MIHRTEYIIYLYKSLAEHIIKNEIMQLLSKYTYENNIMNTETVKRISQIHFILTCCKDWLKSLNKRVALQSLFIYYTMKNMGEQYKNNKNKITVPTWNDELELINGSFSVPDIQDYFIYIIKKRWTVTTNPLIHLYIKKINNRLVFRKRWV